MLFCLVVGYQPPAWLKMTLSVSHSVCIWKMLFWFPNNSINCTIWILEMTFMKLTRYYSNIYLTAHLFLTFLNLTWLTLARTCFSWKLYGKGILRLKHFISLCFLSRLAIPLNLKNRGLFKSKFKILPNNSIVKIQSKIKLIEFDNEKQKKK